MYGAPVPLQCPSQTRTSVWYSYFGLPTEEVKTTNIKIESGAYFREPVYTMPISVKPKTKEPTAFTDNRIYVSNIPFSFREQDLAAMFYPFGRVLSVEIVTNDRGSKGFGFVTLDSVHACEQARTALHESHVQGRIIEVRRATPTRKKLLPGSAEVLPPPRLCVDLRAPHSAWRIEDCNAFSPRNMAQIPVSRYDFAHDVKPTIAKRLEPLKRATPSPMCPFGAIGDSPKLRRCVKHSDLKLTSTGEYFLKSGELTSDQSLLLCLNGQHHHCGNVDAAMFPDHIHDQIASLLETTGSPKTSPRAGSAGVRTSESEATSSDDERMWTPNRSPDLLASLYEGSTSFHAVQPENSLASDAGAH